MDAESAPVSAEEQARNDYEAEMAWRSMASDPRTIEREEDRAWAEHDLEKHHPEYSGLPEDIVKKAVLHGVPAEIVRAAAEHGFGIDYLISAKESPAARKRLEALGIPWGKEAEPPVPRIKDPKVAILKQGLKQREQVAKTKEEVEKALRTRLGSLAIRSSLKRVGGPVPIVRKYITQPRIARKIYKKHVKHRAHEVEEAAKKGEVKMFDTGLLGLDRAEKKEILKKVREIDREVALYRSKLNPANSHQYRKHENERHDLAEELVRLHKKLAALEKSLLEPEGIYDRSKFGDEHKAYQRSVLTQEDQGKYDFLPKRDKPVEPEEIAGADHPDSSP